MISNEKILKLLTFKQGNAVGLGKAPHKPVLILAVIKAIETGIVVDNRIYITPELVSYFMGYWSKLVTSGHNSNFALPFFHLKNEKSGIWTLINKPGYDFVLTSSNSIRSFKALNEATDYACLNEQFFRFLKEKENRSLIRSLILKKYFPNVAEDLLNGQYDYLKVLEDQILNDSSAVYVSRVSKILEKDDAEEEVFLRGATFKKQIPKLYDYSCAITGMRIVAVNDISLIDACHIVPFAESYDDTIHNGISLCPNMHRAFDRGIISIDENFKVLVSEKFLENYTSYSIHQFEGKSIKLPKTSKYYPAQEKLEKHRRRFDFK